LVTTFAPRTADEVTDAVRWALAAGEALEVVAAGTKRSLGRPVGAPHRLEGSALSGVVSYEPAELVLTACPGTPMVEIEAALAECSQCLAFEPPDYAALLGGESSAGTLGGAVAAGLSGPRRMKAGAARDHVLGIAAVSGRGERFVAGGKVVKNVTGYDLPKLMTGSYGTLAVLTEITLKVLPVAEDASTLIVGGLTTRAAVQAMVGVLQSPLEVSGACHFPRDGGADSTTAFRLEGFTPSVEFRLGTLRQQLGHSGPLRVLERDETTEFWRQVRDVKHFATHSEAERVVWRLSVPPAASADVLERIEQTIPGARAFLDWGGGLMWVQLAPLDGTAHALLIRAALGASGGHATLIRAPASMRATTEVFHPQPVALAALSKRVKAQFDPANVLNPGRMYADS
jgi:glycolate dehydrogenase FAD-binding subunit